MSIARSFVDGLIRTGEVMASILGGTVSVIMALLILAFAAWIFCVAFSGAFDCYTKWLVKCWEKKGTLPKGKWAQVIMKGSDDNAPI